MCWSRSRRPTGATCSKTAGSRSPDRPPSYATTPGSGRPTWESRPSRSLAFQATGGDNAPVTTPGGWDAISVLTITRRVGTGAAEVAALVAERLGFELLDDRLRGQLLSEPGRHWDE